MEDFTTAHANHSFCFCQRPSFAKTTQDSTYESSSSGSWRFCRGETSLRWGSWLKAGLGTGLVFLMAQSQNGIGNGSTTNSRLSSSSALSTLLRRRAVGRGSRSHEGSRERPTSRGELPLDVESAQSAFRRSERHHHDRRQPRKENEDGGLERKTLPLDCESSGERKNALNPNQPIALSQEFGPFYWPQAPPHLRPRRIPESPDSLPVSYHVIPCMEV